MNEENLFALQPTLKALYLLTPAVIISSYSDLFKGLFTVPDEIHIDCDPFVPPVQMPLQKITLPILDKVKTAVSITGSPISHVQSVKILGVTFNSDLDGCQHASTVRAKTTKTLAVLCQIGGSLNTRAYARVFKACMKHHVEYCLPVWACCGSEHLHLDKLLVWAKCIITNQKSASIAKSDFKTLGVALLHDFMMLLICTQYFNYIHSGHNSIHLLSQNNVAKETRASVSNKACIQKSKRSCDNCFLSNALKLWNSLPNAKTSLDNYYLFYNSVFKHIFSENVA